MGWLVELLQTIGRNLKAWMLISDNVAQLQASSEECHADIENLTRFLDSVNGVVKSISKYGSEGAVNAIKAVGLEVEKLSDKLQEREDKLHSRISKLDEKIDGIAQEQAMLKGIVVNGKH